MAISRIFSATFIICMTLLIILTLGEPDLLDGLMFRLMNP